MPNERNESLRQLRVTDPQGHPVGWQSFPINSLPPSQYAISTDLYHPLPPNIGTTDPALGAILQGGLGAPHEPTREQLMIEAIMNWRKKQGSRAK